MTEFIFVRHGKTDYKLVDDRKFIGHGRDLAPLSKLGIKQIKNTSKDKRLIESEIIIASPYTRALQSAAIISKEIGVEIIVEVDLHEWIPDIINFQHKTSEDCFELCRDYEKHNGMHPKGEVKAWESIERMKSRVDSVLERYTNYDRVVVVCHGMVIRTQIHKEKIENGEILVLNK